MAYPASKNETITRPANTKINTEKTLSIGDDFLLAKAAKIIPKIKRNGHKYEIKASLGDPATKIQKKEIKHSTLR